jgi:sugar O-acyltransferase (sialic acid O-acetyltransferase NeuD family)
MDVSKKLIIVGFSGFGKEVYWLAHRLGVSVMGFLDDNPSIQGLTYRGTPVLGTVDEWTDYADCVFVIAVGSPRIRKKIYGKMIVGGQPDFATLVDPAVVIHREFSTVGAGSIICAGTILTVDIVIGSHVIINLNCTVGHDVVIQDFVTVAPMVAISGNVTLAQLCEVGTGASIRQGLSLDKGSMLGMGGVLTKSIAENTVFFGNPAKAFKKIAD